MLQLIDLFTCFVLTLLTITYHIKDQQMIIALQAMRDEVKRFGSSIFSLLTLALLLSVVAVSYS